MTTIKNVKKSDDYAIVHADGVITEIGSEVTKLIFYQQVHLPTKEDTLDQSDMTKVLQFEVRIPKNVIRGISTYISQWSNYIDENTQATIQAQDEKITNLNSDLASKLQNLLVDSNTDYSEDKEVSTLLEQVRELRDRLERQSKNNNEVEEPEE